MNETNNKDLCKKCIWYEPCGCYNNKAICINNSEYIDADEQIKAICEEVNK